MRVLITGGSGGLGSALALRLASNLNVSDIVTMGRDGCDYNCDFASTMEISRAIVDMPGIDIVVHCAGKNMIVPHDALQPFDIMDMVAVNAVSNYTINKLLKEQKRLKVSCHVISDAAWTPMTHSLAYNVSKAAQLMLMRQMAHEDRSYIIFGICPGKISDTGMSKYIDNAFPILRGMTYEEGRAYQMSRLKTGEMKPDTVAEFIEKLLFSATKHHHGQHYSIGG